MLLSDAETGTVEPGAPTAWTFGGQPGNSVASILTLPSTPSQRRLAAWACCALIAVMLTSVQTVGRQVPAINGPSFLVMHDILLACWNELTGFLLIAQFRRTCRPALLCLAAGFMVAGGMAVLHTLSIPGLILRDAALGTPNSPMWIRVVWLSAVSAGALAAVIASHRTPVSSDPARAIRIGLFVVSLTIVTVLFMATPPMIGLFPDLTSRPENFAAVYFLALPVILIIQIAALGAVWISTRGRTVVSLWLMLAICSIITETVVGWFIPGMWPELRYSLNFYLARACGLAASSCLLIALLQSVASLYDRLASYQRSLERQNQALTVVGEANPDALLVVDQAARIKDLNSQAATMFGYPRARLIGAPLDLLMPERFRSRHRGLHRSYMMDPVAREMSAGQPLHARRSDGTEFPVDIRIGPVAVDSEVWAIATLRDLTERIALDKELSEAREREAVLAERDASNRALHVALESTTDNVAVFDRDWRFTYLNDRAAIKIGRGPNLIGQALWDVLPCLDESDIGPALRKAMHSGNPVSVDAFIPTAGSIWNCMRSHRPLAWPYISAISPRPA